MIEYNSLTDREKERILKKEYETLNNSFACIAQKYNTYPNKIRRDAQKLGIKIKDKSEAQQNALLKGVIKHPTKGKKRTDEEKTKIGFGVMKNWDSLDDNQLQLRKQKARENWDNLSDDQKDNMLYLANTAVREASKYGSKLEKFLLELLIKDGYKTEFHKEQSLLNTKLQIDLFLPELNIAIEVDGPSHHEPVWGEDSLGRIIKYDQKKTGLILGKGLVLIRIKQTKDFAPSRAKVVYSELKSIIDKIITKFPEINNRYFNIGE
jgi:very-short-patch-repair endonuclease